MSVPATPAVSVVRHSRQNRHSTTMLRSCRLSSADLFQCQGQHFIVYVDRLTGWPCVARLGHSTTSHAVIIALRRWSPDIDVPAVLMTDGGQPFFFFCNREYIINVIITVREKKKDRIISNRST